MNGWLRRLSIVIVTLLVATGCAVSVAQPQTGAELGPAAAARLDSAINDVLRANDLPGAIVGIWSPQGDYVRAFGLADRATGAPMRTDFYSRIGSETKTFTITAVLQLADQNRIGLDDPIGRHLDGVPGGEAITVRQLAGMQSGLANYTETAAFRDALITDPHRTYPPQQLLAWAFAEPPVFAPGQGYQYSNTNTILLGLLVEKVTGQTLADYVAQHILAPLKMRHTGFAVGAEFPDPHAVGYTENLGDGETITATDWNPSWAWAAGAMFSTLEDLRVWAPAVATGALVSPAMQRQRLQTVGADGQPAESGYGLGIFRFGGWIGHNGSLPGYQTVAVDLPQRSMTMVILVNTDIDTSAGDLPSTALANAITRVITPEHVYDLNG